MYLRKDVRTFSSVFSKNIFKIRTVLPWTEMDTMDINVSMIVCNTIPKNKWGTQLLDGRS